MVHCITYFLLKNMLKFKKLKLFIYLNHSYKCKICAYNTEEIMEELVKKAQKGDKEAFTRINL